jgi:16S rRNA (cytidine1402-2'-O)-methyltransferase
MSGTLFIVSTPIGNGEDITFRAVKMLKEVDIIAAEDTRHSKRLLQKWEVHTPLLSFHQHSNPEKVLSLLRKGKNVALISDAGTPGISDPGTNLVALSIAENIVVSPLPGPSAIISALCASGLPTNHFKFFGFLPQKKGRKTFFQNIAGITNTIIFYESTHRIEKCVREMCEYIPKRKIVLARELTKIYEEFLRGTPEEIYNIFQEFPEKKKGEFVVLIDGAS